MDVAEVKGLAWNGSTMEWLKLKSLGKGSFGVVHLVTPKFSHQLLAVKSSSYQLASSLQKERQILKTFVGSRNIVQCYGDMLSYEQGELVYNLFLEFAPCGCLWDLIIDKFGGKIPEYLARFFARMVAEGLKDIHDKGYVHCDIKPENILVYPSNLWIPSLSRLKIADFGLARPSTACQREDEKPKGFPGTAVYMPPECVIGGRISAALDIWSLGCVVLVMITGKLPWQYESRSDLRLKLATWESPEIPEDMSSAGKDFLRRCFARDPTKRWSADMLLSHPFLVPDYFQIDWSVSAQPKSNFDKYLAEPYFGVPPTPAGCP